MPNVDSLVGRIRFHDRGTYSAAVTYYPMDTVTQGYTKYYLGGSTPVIAVSPPANPWKAFISLDSLVSSIQAAESGRLTAEQTRNTQELTRQTQETNRQNAEVTRATFYAGFNTQLVQKSNFEANALWRTAAGNPVTFYPAPETPLHYAIKTMATQAGAGAGDPSPENVRPILPAVAAGQTTIRRTGKNLLDFSGTVTLANCARINIDNGVRLTTQTTGNASATWRLPLTLLGKTVSIQATMRAVSGVSVGHQIWLNFGSATNTTVQSIIMQTHVNGYLSGTATIPSSLPNGAEWLAFRVYANLGTGEVGAVVEFTNLQVELGPTVSAYEPYTSAAYTLTVQQALYGLPGAEDEIRSDGTEVHRSAFIALTGTENILLQTAGIIRCVVSSSAGAISSHFKALSSTGFADLSCASNTSGVYLRYDSVFTTAAAAKAWIAAQYAAGTPVQLLCPLSTPTVLPGTPVPATTLPQLSRTTPRQNVLLADVGTLSVEYAKSPIRESDEIRAAVTTLGGIFNV